MTDETTSPTLADIEAKVTGILVEQLGLEIDKSEIRSGRSIIVEKLTYTSCGP